MHAFVSNISFLHFIFALFLAFAFILDIQDYFCDTFLTFQFSLSSFVYTCTLFLLSAFIINLLPMSPYVLNFKMHFVFFAHLCFASPFTIIISAILSSPIFISFRLYRKSVSLGFEMHYLCSTMFS